MNVRLSALAFGVLAIASCATVGPLVDLIPPELVYLSPANGDGVNDELSIDIDVTLANNRPLTSYRILVSDADGAIVFSREESELNFTFPATITIWDGRDNTGAFAPDGAYQVVLQAIDRRRAVGESQPVAVIVDNTPPAALVSVSTRLFSPFGEGKPDRVTFEQSGSAEDLWSGRILAPEGTEVAAFSWDQGAPASFQWNGRTATDQPLADGTYRYELTATDRAGNPYRHEVSGIRIDSTDARPRRVAISATAAGLSPNGDGVADTLAFNTFVEINTELRAWTLDIVTVPGGVRQTIARGTDSVPAQLSWNGQLGGSVAREGEYFATLWVEYPRAAAVEERTGRFRIDLSGPTLRSALAPIPFSPDGDGEADLLTLSLVASDPSGIRAREISIFDRVGNLFVRLPMARAQESITWSGRSASDELVLSAEEYDVRFAASDTLGNSAGVSQPLPIDILVIRDGDRLRIQIAAIFFAAFTADFDPAHADDNRRTLARLAEVLRRFPNHRIRVEGHAVQIYWFNPERAIIEQRDVLVPLSKARADVVARALGELGIDETRMTTAGLGAAQPVVPHRDLENRWKNRRVEFILVR